MEKESQILLVLTIFEAEAIGRNIAHINFAIRREIAAECQ